MKINKISSKLIKPHIPTPHILKKYHLSFIDQHQRPLNFAVVLFYESNPDNNIQLQESLARILVEFYPLAGRYIKNDHVVDCSDQGAEFIEAEALDVELIDLVYQNETDQLNALLPEPYFRVGEDPDASVLSIQATQFPSGGVAVAISVSHRVFDASSLCTFVAAWSDATNPDRTVGITPTFDIPSLLPYKDLGHRAGSDQPSNCGEGIDVKRFWFKKRAITSLRSKVKVENTRKTISGVRVVCAVVARALIRLDHAKHGQDRDFVITQPINMRERTASSPQPKHACGNFLVACHTPRVAGSDAKGSGVQELVDLIGDSVRKSIADYAELLSPDRDGRDIMMNLSGEVWDRETNVIVFSDWSKLGFYEADFGWGKPVWTRVGLQRPPPPFTNATVLMSDKEGDGIEAWVYLNQNDMSYFEQDEGIKLFTT